MTIVTVVMSWWWRQTCISPCSSPNAVETTGKRSPRPHQPLQRELTFTTTRLVLHWQHISNGQWWRQGYRRHQWKPARQHKRQEYTTFIICLGLCPDGEDDIVDDDVADNGVFVEEDGDDVCDVGVIGSDVYCWRCVRSPNHHMPFVWKCTICEHKIVKTIVGDHDSHYDDDVDKRHDSSEENTAFRLKLQLSK